MEARITYKAMFQILFYQELPELSGCLLESFKQIRVPLPQLIMKE